MSNVIVGNKTALVSSLLEQLAYQWPLSPNQEIIRLETQSSPIDLIQALSSQTQSPKLYWGDRESPFKIAAFGAILDLKGLNNAHFESDLAKIKSFLPKNNPNFRFFGGRRFSSVDSAEKESTWQHFGFYRFILPEFEWREENGTTYFACYIKNDPQKSVSDYQSEIESL